MTGGDEVVSRGDVRASHEDRERAVDLLRVAAGDGRLTAEELDQRLEKALTARTHGELAAVTGDLPEPTGALPKELVRIDCGSGIAKRDGRWLVPERMEIKVTNGSVRLDFTEAVISRPSLRIEADVGSGVLRLVTRPGIVVDGDDVTVRNGVVRVRKPWASDAPEVLRIHVSGAVHSGVITAHPPRLRRTFWQWLLRRGAYRGEG